MTDIQTAGKRIERALYIAVDLLQRPSLEHVATPLELAKLILDEATPTAAEPTNTQIGFALPEHQ